MLYLNTKVHIWGIGVSNLLHSVVAHKKRPVVYTHPDVSVAQCIETMVQDDIGALVVTDDANILGILSERDVIRSLLYKGLSPTATKASDILTADVTVLKSTDTVEMAMQAMTYSKRRHILVVDEGKLTAIVSIGDILFSILENKSLEIEQLQNYIHTY